MSGKKFLYASIAALGLTAMVSGSAMSAAAAPADIQKAPFGKTSDGKDVQLYTLTNKNGLEASISTYGGTLVSLKVPDRNGKLGNIVLGFKSVDNYVKGVPFFGATIGRYGNRIANGEFSLDGKTYRLARNDGPNNLHGGVKGFDKVLWQAAPAEDKDGPVLKLKYVAADGEEGYPGALTVHVTYQLHNNNSLSITYEATTTKPTPVNLTNHSYFNLTGNSENTILDHELVLNASHFTPINKVMIPTGEIKDVTGTPFDFRKATKIGARINADNEQLRFAGGYDHNWVLDKSKPGEMTTAAILSEKTTGRVVKIRTTEPGVQFYSGNFLNGKPAGAGTVYKHRTGLCLETQHFPNSPNQKSFPSTILRPGQTYKTQTVFFFETEK